MQRRKFIAGLGSLTAAGAAGIGTGAFASVSADRGVTVNVADDSNAYLGLSSDSEYASGASSGELSIDLGAVTDAGGSGLNEDSTTNIREVFTITNQGTKPVAVYIDSEALNTELEPGNDSAAASNQIHFFVGVPGGASVDSYDPDSLSTSGGSFDNPSDNRIVGAGNSVDIGLYVVNSGDVEWDDVSEDITVSAYDAKTIANNDVGPTGEP